MARQVGSGLQMAEIKPRLVLNIHPLNRIINQL